IFTTAHEEAIRHDRFQSAPSNHERIRIQSCSSRRASYWLTTPPSEPQRQMSNHQFAVAVRTRLNMMPFARMPLECCDGLGRLMAVSDDFEHMHPSIPSHAHWCQRSQGAWVRRHNHVVNTLASLGRMCGVDCRVEPRDEAAALRERAAAGELDDDERRRNERHAHVVPDVVMHTGHGTMVVDVSVLHPLSPCYASKWKADNAEREQAAIRKREKMKTTHYRRYTSAIRGGKTAPFVVDAMGAFGADAELLLHWLADAAAASHSFDSHAAFIDTALAWLSVALQVGNAMLADHAVTRMRSAAHRHARESVSA